MATGTPAIASAVGGLEASMAGFPDHLVPPGDYRCTCCRESGGIADGEQMTLSSECGSRKMGGG